MGTALELGNTVKGGGLESVVGSFVGLDSKDLLKNIVFFVLLVSSEFSGDLFWVGEKRRGEEMEVGGVRELSLSRSSRPAKSSG